MQRITLFRAALLLPVALLVHCQSPSTDSEPRAKEGRTSGSMNAADSNPPPPKVSAEEGRRFLDKGLESVKAQEWSLAAGYFAKARESDPWSAAALFNLGLVNAKAGHERPAMAWLHAYLAASPAASNVPAVREEIERLKSQLRAKVKRMLETSSDGAIKLQDQHQKNDALNLLYLAKAIAGDIQGAVATRRLDSYY